MRTDGTFFNPSARQRNTAVHEGVMPVEKVNYGRWLFRLITWDGLLPGCVVLVPTVIEFLIPNNRGAIEFASVMLPVIGLLIRIRLGLRHIGSNHCTVAARCFQLCAFVLGILLLGLIECVLMLTHVMPPLIFVDWTDIVECAIPFLIYATLMAIAMYPGRAPSQQETAGGLM
jgi:hypothetical protein